MRFFETEFAFSKILYYNINININIFSRKDYIMKFISSSYDPETGISKVVMQHLGIKFTGTARLHPEDERGSSFAGCEYAEIRAIIKALKYERKLAKQKADMAIDFVKSCECYKKFTKESPSAKAVYRQLNQRIKKVNDITDEINHYLLLLDKNIHSRQIVLNALEKKKTKEDNS